MSRHHSRNAVHKWVKRGRTGQIVAVGAVGYYGFTTIGNVNIRGVEKTGEWKGGYLRYICNCSKFYVRFWLRILFYKRYLDNMRMVSEPYFNDNV